MIGARAATVAARFDLVAAADAEQAEARIWHHLVRERRQVSRAAYDALAAQLPSLRPKVRRYRIAAGEVPVAVALARRPAKGRRPSSRVNDLR